MEPSPPTHQEFVSQVYEYAANLLMKVDGTTEVEQLLRAQGLDAENARAVVHDLAGQIRAAKQAQAKKDILHGGLWCVGGTALTVADIGFIFWGAVVFGGFQFMKGVINLR